MNMEESSLPPVFKDTAPTQTITDIDYTNIENLREDMLNSLEAMEPRIDSLQQTFDQLIKQSDNSSQGIGSDVLNQINQILPRMQNIHSNSINTSRKIQALSLNQQTVQTLSIPKQMRPVHDEFFAFRDEFDLSLKNVASLSRNLTQKFDSISSTIDPIKDLPKSIDETLNDMLKEHQKTKENNQFISHAKADLFQEIRKSQQSLVQLFEQKIGLAETIVNEMVDKADNGVDNSEKMKKKLKQQQTDVNESFNNLLTEIQKTTGSKLDDLEKSITRMNEDSKKEIKKLRLQFDAEFNQLEQIPIPETNYSEVDETEKEKEISELEILIERFDRLYRILKTGNARKEGEDFEDHEGEWEGRKVIFRCFDNGTFTIIEKNSSPKEEDKQENLENNEVIQDQQTENEEDNSIDPSNSYETVEDNEKTIEQEPNTEEEADENEEETDNSEEDV